MIKTYEQAEQYILDIPKFTKKNEPQKTAEFLQYLGNPCSKIKVIHIAGTNGKGSVCAYLRSVLLHMGRTVGMFTSPHLVCIRERFALGQDMISESDFLRICNQVICRIEAVQKDKMPDYHPTYFEFLFFMAMLWYEEQNPEFLILETGLGGRLDATNSYPTPKLCVITEIGMDHMEYLGNTKEEIAYEKAGIIKEGVPVVFWNYPETVGKVILDTATKKKCLYVPVSKSDILFLKTGDKRIDFSLHSRYYDYVSFQLNTIAVYQAENASLAFRALELLLEQEAISCTVIQEGFAEMRWPARMEEISKGIYLDGAHNEDGIRAFLETVEQDGHAGERRLVFAAVSDKQVEKMTQMIASKGLFKYIYVADLQIARAADVDRISSILKQYDDIDVGYFDTAVEAFRKMVSERAIGDICYIAGSLYLAGQIKEAVETEQI